MEQDQTLCTREGHTHLGVACLQELLPTGATLDPNSLASVSGGWGQFSSVPMPKATQSSSSHRSGPESHVTARWALSSPRLLEPRQLQGRGKGPEKARGAGVLTPFCCWGHVQQGPS